MRNKQTQNLNTLLSHWHNEDDDRMYECMLSSDLRKYQIHW